MRAARLVAIALAAAAGLPAASHAAAPLIASDPPLQPRFSHAVADYAVRCPDRSLELAARRQPGTRVTLAGRRVRKADVPIEPGQALTLRVSRDRRTTRHFVRCVPDDFPGWTFRRVGPQAPRWYLMTLGVSFGVPHQPFVAVFDHHGVPVWWYRSATGLGADAQLVGGNIGYFESLPGSFGADDVIAFRIRRPDGGIVRTIRAVGVPTDFHELREIGRDHLILAYRPRRNVDLSAYGGPADATVVDSEIQRVDRRGRLVWSWSSRDHIGLAETGRWWPHVRENTVKLADGTEAYDLTHINAVEIAGEDLLVSMRHTDAIYKLRIRDGGIRWKLGGTPTRRSLRVLGDPADYPFGGQHDVRLWRGTVTVHDNGTDLARAPRVVRYAIDTERRTATLLESIADPLVSDSLCCGSARKLANGDWLVGWGGHGISATLTPQGSLVNRFTIEGVFSYRTVAESPDAVSRPRLRAGMDALYAAGEAD
jgi:hypothetical protein